MKTTLIIAWILASACAERAGADPVPAPVKFAVGLGAGFESGNGVHLGIAKGRNMGRLGLGLIYNDQDAEFDYSVGARFLRVLYTGRINDTYAWTGFGLQGHVNDVERGYLGSEGIGVGVSFHLGTPFHLDVDSGWHAYHDSGVKGIEIQWGPTLNGALLYEW